MIQARDWGGEGMSTGGASFDMVDALGGAESAGTGQAASVEALPRHRPDLRRDPGPVRDWGAWSACWPTCWRSD